MAVSGVRLQEIRKGAQIVFSMIAILLATISAWEGQYLLSVAWWILSILIDIRLELEGVNEKLVDLAKEIDYLKKERDGRG